MADKRGTHTHILHLRAASIAIAVVIALLTLLAARTAQAQTFTTIFSFNGSNGADPVAGLLQGTDGNLYGITGSSSISYGTVFKITPGGTETTLYTFCTQTNCPDGSDPRAGLVQAGNGSLYGTTFAGGTGTFCSFSFGCGTVFRITLDGTLTTLYNFASQSGDGVFPGAGLVQASNGNLYGTTSGGGANGGGTVFEITPDGTLTTLYSFCSQSDCTDGGSPWGALVQATNGSLYGTTSYGGATNSSLCSYSSCGTVFKITPSGTLTTLYSFCSQAGCTDGNYPTAGLVQAIDGNLYGTTYTGGANDGCFLGTCGTVFKITPTGTLTTLYSFCSQSNCTDGENPWVGLIQATDGNLYGTTPYGGANGPDDGTIFKITPGGTLRTLYSFCSQYGCTDGSWPLALVEDTNGSLYGTTDSGGAIGYGTVFSLSMGLAPFVETQPTLGPVGIPVKILGTNLTGATSVTFNGTPAVFNVLSPSLIGARVPAGATTGTVQVVTPGGTLSSNVPFRVRQ